MFYINPPTGQVVLHILENCVLTRLEYLQLLHEGKDNEFSGNFEYLLENSVYDKIGHFTLRLLASKSPDLWNYWITKETLLFRTRLTDILPRQLHRLFRNIVRQLRIFTDLDKSIIKCLINTCNFFLMPCVFKHIALNNHTENCTEYKIKVRFELVPDLVSTRKLDLKEGYAIVYCSKWKGLLVSLFHTYMTKEGLCVISQAQRIINQDIRLDYLYHKVYSRVFDRSHGSGRVTIENIDTEAKNFPLCMQHLHTKLKSTHRLSHYARLYYSLFLKDSGMQIEDAINYWKREYSKPHACSSICSHNWQSNERKFIYSIRHLYGLEGSRKNYKAPTCENMCASVSGPAYEGGCPFKNFDANTLKNLLQTTLLEEEAKKLLNSIPSQKPQVSCTEVFKILSKTEENNITISSPTQYYLKMQKALKMQMHGPSTV